MKKLLFYVLFLHQFAFSQAEKLFVGKIIVANATSKGVHVINLVNEKEAISDEKGEFRILAKEDDLLVFSAIHLDYFRKIIAFADFKTPVLTITMTSKVNQLDEVEIVNYDKINAVNLGILQKPAKKYTPAERRLKTATALDATANAGTMMGGSIGLDPLLNWISGRTKLLKNGLKVERREILLKKISNLYSDEFYISTLKINSINIRGFQYYSIEDEKFAAALSANNKPLIAFLLTDLALSYNKILSDEQQ